MAERMYADVRMTIGETGRLPDSQLGAKYAKGRVGEMSKVWSHDAPNEMRVWLADRLDSVESGHP